MYCAIIKGQPVLNVRMGRFDFTDNELPWKWPTFACTLWLSSGSMGSHHKLEDVTSFSCLYQG